ncbi:MAG: hypothetical protein AAB019_01705 [Planctomycetota bacterium]
MKKLLGVVIMLLVAVVLISCESTSTTTQTTKTEKQVTAPTIKAPWADCGVGSWIHYKTFLPDDTIVEAKETMVKLENDTALIERSVLTNGEWISQGTAPVKLTGMYQTPIPKEATQTETLKIGNKEVHCKIVVMVATMGENKTEIFQWMSHDVPGGLVKKAMGGKVVREVVAFEKK